MTGHDGPRKALAPPTGRGNQSLPGTCRVLESLQKTSTMPARARPFVVPFPPIAKGSTMLRPLGRVFWIGLLVAGAALPSASAQAQTTLRYKFKEGDKLNYVMEQKQEMAMSFMGNDINTKINQTMDMTWKIGAVDKDGSAKMTQTIDRIRMTMDSPGAKIEYDTKDGKEP